jgi:4-amino-4-deoxy-L-arabinose transferase-like glycosyltransferase
MRDRVDDRPRNRAPAAAGPPDRLFSIAALYWFFIGLACRFGALGRLHLEGDETIYRILVGQLDAGRGYTLIGAMQDGQPLIGHGWPADQYGRALFFHPPGGIALFWLLHRIAGDAGFGLAQLLSYAVYFFALLACAHTLIPSLRGARLHAFAALAAFTPIMAHVASRWWLDAPMLALGTLAAALYLAAVKRGDLRGAIVAGLVMGGASWVKAAVFAIVPGLLLVGWAMLEPGRRRDAVRLGLAFSAAALLVQLPWELWQWRAVGSPFPAWAGRPSPQLVAENHYVHLLTVERPAWMYVTLLPRIVWTIVPALAGLAVTRPGSPARRIGLALAAWAAIVVAVVVGLGAIGYSKLLRYAVMVTPATVLLFAVTCGEAWTRLREAPRGAGMGRLKLVVAIAVVGLALEIVQGLYSSMVDHSDILRPFYAPGAWMY